MPLDIATFFPVGELRPYLCKMTCFQLAFTSTGSAIVLLGIAIVRYNGIRKPLQGLFSTKSAIYVIVPSILTASGFALPITFLFGEGQLIIVSNVTAEICAVERRFIDTSGPMSYYFVLAGLYLITLCFHSFFYVRSVIMVWSRRGMFVSVPGSKNAVIMTPKITRAHNNTVLNLEERSNTSSQQGGATRPTRVRTVTDNNHFPHETPIHPTPNINETPMRSGNASSSKKLNMLRSVIDPKRKGNKPRINKSQINSTHEFQPAVTPQIMSYSNASTMPVRGQSTAGSHADQTSQRVLLVVMAISVTFFLSYAPHFGIMFYLFTNDNDVFTESAQSLVFELFMRSFFLNNVLDIVIYGLLSSDFRKEAGRTLRKVFCIRKCRLET